MIPFTFCGVEQLFWPLSFSSALYTSPQPHSLLLRGDWHLDDRILKRSGLCHTMQPYTGHTSYWNIIPINQTLAQFVPGGCGNSVLQGVQGLTEQGWAGYPPKMPDYESALPATFHLSAVSWSSMLHKQHLVILQDHIEVNVVPGWRFSHIEPIELR